MLNEVTKVYSNSIAEEVGIEIGDKLISINGNEIRDIIDYKFLITDEEILLEVEKINGEIWEVEIEKDYDESLGVEFKEAIMDKAISCCNKCIFCFIDQLPKGMRKTLYFKDDDSRLSFLQGNFVTLTNMKDEDLDRIIRYRISPINISVQTTNPILRVKMLNNRFAGDILEKLKKLAKGAITMNTQIVLCPNINGGDEFIKTVEDLYALYPAVQNVAAVPFGGTKYREGLFNIEMYNSKTAKKELAIAEKLQKRFMKEIGKPFLNMADEFYLLSDVDVPEESFYGDYEQIEDGIGMIRIFRENINNSLCNLNIKGKGQFTFVTGHSAFKEIKAASEKIMEKNHKIKIDTVKVINNFFGETITVAGLLTGRDIINELRKIKLGEYIIIPDVMLRKDYELSDNSEKVFLDDVTINQMEEELKTKILVCDYTGEDLINIINEHVKEEN